MRIIKHVMCMCTDEISGWYFNTRMNVKSFFHGLDILVSRIWLPGEHRKKKQDIRKVCSEDVKCAVKMPRQSTPLLDPQLPDQKADT